MRLLVNFPNAKHESIIKCIFHRLLDPHIHRTNEIDCHRISKRSIRMRLTFINLYEINFNMFERCLISIAQQITRCPKFLCCSETVMLRGNKGVRLKKLDQNDATSVYQQKKQQSFWNADCVRTKKSEKIRYSRTKQ